MAVGDLDTTCVPQFDNTIYALAGLADGKILIGGEHTTVNSIASPTLSQINPDGSLDTGFTSPLTSSDFVENFALFEDGKIVAVGSFPSIGADVKVARFNVDGSLDASFANLATTGYVGCCTVRSDGKVVIGGSFTAVAGQAYAGVAILNSDGTLDTTWLDPAVSGGTVLAIAFQTDGKMVICGWPFAVNGSAFTPLARLNPDGTHDTAFLHGVTADGGKLSAVSIQEDGKIVVVGDYNFKLDAASVFAVARLNADGSTDTGFATHSSFFEDLIDVAIQGDGKIIVSGDIMGVGGEARTGVARLNADGTVDLGFPDPMFDYRTYGMALAPDGGILTGGQTTNVGGTPVYYFAKIENDYVPPLPPGTVDLRVIASALAFATACDGMPTVFARELLRFDSALGLTWEGTAALRDVLTLDEGLALVFRELMQVSLVLGDSATVTTTAIVQMVDALLLGGVVNSELEAVALIVEALTFGALLESSNIATLQSGLSFGDSIAQTYQAMVALVDSLLVGETVASQVTMVAAIGDALTLGADGTYSYEAHAVLRDGLAFVMRLAIDNEDYVAWAINTESKALSRYTQYPFNSFMKVGDKYYGAMDTGLCSLEGADDAGAPIEAKLRLGMSSMGTRVLKRSPAMYAGYTASGDLLLKVVTATAIDGVREAHAYRLIARAAGSVREGRVPIGRGLKSAYFDYQLENIDGADFELDVIEFQPLVLERRVRGNSGGKR